MSEIWIKIFFLLFVAIGLVSFTFHLSFYNRALKLMRERGLSIAGYELTFWGVGSGGVMGNIKNLKQQYGHSLSSAEVALLNSSSKAYNVQIIIIAPFAVFILWWSISGIVNR